MSAIAMTHEVKISVGSTGESVYLLRTVVASLAAKLDLSLDDIDDLSLAVSEAAAFLLAEATQGSRLVMRISTSKSGVEAVLSIGSAGGEWPPADIENTLAWKILSALADQAEFVRDDEGPAIRLLKAGPQKERLQ